MCPGTDSITSFLAGRDVDIIDLNYKKRNGMFWFNKLKSFLVIILKKY